MHTLRWTPLERATAQDADATTDDHSLYTLLGPNPLWLINACFILIAIGQLALMLLVVTFLFSPPVRRRNAGHHPELHRGLHPRTPSPMARAPS